MQSKTKPVEKLKESEVENLKESDVALRRSSRLHKSKVFPDYITCCVTVNPTVPVTVEEALQGPERNH